MISFCKTCVSENIRATVRSSSDSSIFQKRRKSRKQPVVPRYGANQNFLFKTDKPSEQLTQTFVSKPILGDDLSFLILDGFQTSECADNRRNWWEESCSFARARVQYLAFVFHCGVARFALFEGKAEPCQTRTSGVLSLTRTEKPARRGRKTRRVASGKPR